MESFETLVFYRGLSKPLNTDSPVILNVRKNRKPRDSDNMMHQNADTWFEKKFGVRYRSQSLFVTSSIFTARGYAESKANIVRVIPITPYSFCWSPIYNDLLSFIPAASDKRMSIEEFLESGLYKETNLEEAHNSGHELMLACEQYIAIPLNTTD